jgi:hypothetical protein
MKQLLLLSLLAVNLQACLNPQEFTAEELQALVDAELEQKIRTYRSIKMERCREDLEARANFIVDSLIFVQSQQRIDSLFTKQPQKPVRPPAPKVPNQQPVAPLFKSILENQQDSSRTDSLR